MASFVTLPGASGGIVTVQAGSGDHEFIAQIIANTILTASVGGSLNPAVAVTITGNATDPAIVPTPSGGQNILYLYGSGGGNFQVPTGYQYVVDLLTGPETISGTDVQVLAYNSVGGGEGSTFNLSGDVSIAADPGEPDVINVLTGVFDIGAGDGNDTITATGAGTIGGGTGTNLFSITPTVGGAGIRLQSNGLDDSVTANLAAGSTATVVGTGVGLSLVADGAGTLDAQILGLDATVTGGAGALDVSTGGSDAAVLGGSGTLSVEDSGTGDTIAAFGASAVTVDAFGTDAKIFGGSGNLVATLGGVGAQGNNSLFGGSGTTAVSVGGEFNVATGFAGALTATVSGFADTVTASNALTASVLDTGQSNVVTGGSGALNVTIGASGTNNTVIGGSGATAVTSEGADAAIMGGSGSFSVFDTGSSDSIGAFGASPTDVTLAGSSDLLFGSSGSTDVSVSGANDTIVAGTGPLTVHASSAAVLFGNTGPLTFVGGAGTSSIVGASGGSSDVTVGAGGVVFWSGGSDTTSIVGGVGQTTLIGASNSSMFFSGAGGGLSFSAGDGNETLNASGSLTNNIYGAGLDSTGGTTVFGGLGNDTFIAGSGADSLVGGPSDDRFVFFAQATSLNASGAHDYIQDWTSQDGLFLIGYDSTLSASDVIDNGTVANGSLTITLSDNTQITFDNVTDKSEFNGKVLYS